MIESDIPLVLLDARSEKTDDKSTKDEVGKVIETKDTLVVTYCFVYHH